MTSFSSRFPSSDFAPIFRLLDDYDVHRSSSGFNKVAGYPTSSIRAFQPRFDVREEKENYKLEGELPGIDQKDVHIEFTDPHTLVIKGRVEREYSSSNAPVIESAPETARITDAEHQPATSSYHKATVEDENATSALTSAGVDTPTTTTESSLTTSNAAKQAEGPKHKYWVTERSVGEFHRSFSFPTRVDQDAVKASLKNGILSVLVPKMAAQQNRRIQIE